MGTAALLWVCHCSAGQITLTSKQYKHWRQWEHMYCHTKQARQAYIHANKQQKPTDKHPNKQYKQTNNVNDV